MNEKEKLYEKIKDYLKAHRNGVKARVIARQIGAEKKAVNQLLYSADFGKSFRKDFFFKWYLRKSSEKPTAKTEKSFKSPIHPLCKKCMVYKQEDCIGAKELCEFFKPSPEITKEEMDKWPKEMGGPFGTLHKKQHDKKHF